MPSSSPGRGRTCPRRSCGPRSPRARWPATTARFGLAIPGDTLLVEVGTLHAIGAGTFVYEIEQPSDLTFRISDWGRPAVPGRSLHPAESLRALRTDAHAVPVGRGWHLDGGALAVCEFRLEILDLPAPVSAAPVAAASRS